MILPSKQIIAQTQNNTADILARVSTAQQTSIEDQVAQCLEHLKADGFILGEVHRIQGHSSLDLETSPVFQRLYHRIRNGEIRRVYILNRDRLQADKVERLAFISECRKHGVEVIALQGPPIVDSDESDLLVFVEAFGKKQQVLRARLGARDGIRERVTVKGLPVNGKAPYGYKKYNHETNSFEPDDNHDNAKFIFSLFKAGYGTYTIMNMLHERNIPSPVGNEWWSAPTLLSIAKHPLYSGVCKALRRVAVEPKTRRGKATGEMTSGNTSTKRLPWSEAVEVANAKVVKPIVTPAEQASICAAILRRRDIAQRNAKRNFLLRGFIRCEEHARTYIGWYRKSRGHHYYSCPKGGCARPTIPGPEIDNEMKAQVGILLAGSSNTALEKMLGSPDRQRDDLLRDLDRITKNIVKHTDALAKLEIRYLEGEVDTDVYDTAKRKLQFEVDGLKQRQDETLTSIAQADRIEDVKKTIGSIMGNILDVTMKAFDDAKGREHDDRLRDVPELTDEQWRQIFNALNLRVTVLTDESYRTMREYDWLRNSAHEFMPVPDEVYQRSKRFTMSDVTIEVGLHLENVSSALTPFVKDKPRSATNNVASDFLRLTLYPEIEEPTIGLAARSVLYDDQMPRVPATQQGGVT